MKAAQETASGPSGSQQGLGCILPARGRLCLDGEQEAAAAVTQPCTTTIHKSSSQIEREGSKAIIHHVPAEMSYISDGALQEDFSFSATK